MKVFRTILISAGLLSLIALTFSFTKNKKDHGPVKWMSFEEAIAANKKQPRMIIVDVYTTWCGPCKMLSANTFGNEHIAKYMNENFYCVRFDAETRDTVKFTVNVPDTLRDNKGAVKKISQKAQQFVYYNPYPANAQRSTHQFAASILQGYNVAFPSVIFLSKDVKRVDVLQGYMPPQQFEPIVKFFGTGSWEKMKWDEYQKSFKSELGAN